MHAKSLQSCLTLCDPLNCSLPGSSVQEISQARILEWFAMPSSRESSGPRDQTHVLHWQSSSLPLAPLDKPKSNKCAHHPAASLWPDVQGLHTNILAAPFLCNVFFSFICALRHRNSLTLRCFSSTDPAHQSIKLMTTLKNIPRNSMA